jgi:MFS family permease
VTAGAVRAGRPLLTLWIGQLLSGLGDRLHVVALMWIAVDAVGARAGWVLAAGATARLAFGLAGGVYADRWDRRRVMVVCDLFRAVAVASLAAAALAGPPELLHLAAVSAVLGVLDCFFGPALQASLPALTDGPESLQRANAWLNMTPRLAAAVGPALTGPLLLLLPFAQFFALDAVTFVASALAILWLGAGAHWKTAAAAGAGTARAFWPEIRESLRLVAAHRSLAWGLALIGVWNLASPTAMLVGLPLLARQSFAGDAAIYGLLVAAYGVGNVVSNLLLVRIAVRRLSSVLFAGGLIWGLGMLGACLAPTLPLALASLAVAALGGPMTDLMLLNLIQTDFPDQIGKTFSLRMTVSRSCNALGLLLAAPLIGALGVTDGIAVVAVGVAAFAVLARSRAGAGSAPAASR